MTIVRLGYVAMSMELKNASPSKTMTFTQFEKHDDREAAIRKLERIALENLENTHRLLKNNYFNEVHFYRFSSKLIPLANHENLAGWDFMKPLKGKLAEIGSYVQEHKMRVDFHPDHFVVLNSPKAECPGQFSGELEDALLASKRHETRHDASLCSPYRRQLQGH